VSRGPNGQPRARGVTRQWAPHLYVRYGALLCRLRLALSLDAELDIPSLITDRGTVPTPKLGDHVGVVSRDAVALLLALPIGAGPLLRPLELLHALGDRLP
jgi:hypothetical protein